MKAMYGLLTIVMGALTISGCDDRAAYETLTEDAAIAPGSGAQESGDATGLPMPTPGSGDSMAGLCGDTGSYETLTQVIDFYDPDCPCAWNQYDNYSPMQGYIRARTEQWAKLEIPNDATVCGMEFEFPEQEMEFDDEIFLLYNGVILASSYDYSHRFPKRDNLTFYDWRALRNAPYNASAHNSYCLGTGSEEGQCEMPFTETTGVMKLDFAPSIFAKIASYHKKTDPHAFWLVTTGDDNDTDCRHKDFQFTATIHYRK